MKAGTFITLLLCLFKERLNAETFQVEDAIVIEVNNPQSELVQDGQQLKRLPAIRTCVTFDGLPGICQPVQECYPYTKLHKLLSPLETWVIGTRGTCHYAEADGRQVYGVCCRSRQVSLQQLSVANGVTNGNQSGQPVMQTTQVDYSRIVNGKNTDAGEYPFMVAMMEREHVFCGGSLIDANYVLTAAHCVSGYSAKQVSEWTVALGMTDLNDDQKVVRRIKKVIVHNGFDYVRIRNDIALLRLDSPVEFSEKVAPVCLGASSKTDEYDGKDAITTGWGYLGEDKQNTQHLQKVTLQIKSVDDCRQNLGSKAPGGVVDQYICAWAPQKDACTGDSGGPLLVDNCQVGIVSWGIGCATSSYGVYSRISSFREWINRNKILV